MESFEAINTTLDLRPQNETDRNRNNTPSQTTHTHRQTDTHQKQQTQTQTHTHTPKQQKAEIYFWNYRSRPDKTNKHDIITYSMITRIINGPFHYLDGSSPRGHTLLALRETKAGLSLSVCVDSLRLGCMEREIHDKKGDMMREEEKNSREIRRIREIRET